MTENPVKPIVKVRRAMPRSKKSHSDRTETVTTKELSEIERLSGSDNTPPAVPQISIFGKLKDSCGNVRIRRTLSLFTFKTAILFTVQKKKPQSRSRKKKKIWSPITFDEIDTPSSEPSFEETITDIETVKQPRCSTPINSQNSMSLADFYSFFATEEINDISLGGSTNTETIIIENKEVPEDDPISTKETEEVPIIEITKDKLDLAVDKPADEIETQDEPISKKKTKPKVVKKYNCDQCPKSFNKVHYFIYTIIFFSISILILSFTALGITRTLQVFPQPLD